MLFDTTFLIDIDRETKRSRTGPAQSLLLRNPNAPLYTSGICAGGAINGGAAEVVPVASTDGRKRARCDYEACLEAQKESPAVP